jgi:hypothetical protein
MLCLPSIAEPLIATFPEEFQPAKRLSKLPFINNPAASAPLFLFEANHRPNDH